MSEKQELTAKKVRRRRMSSVWLIPMVALVLAGWLVWKNSLGKGPVVTITFETAEGLSEGKTEIRCRSVKVGILETLKLNSGLDGVLVAARIEPDYVDLLHKDSRFWVVRPRISMQSVTGVGTLLSGAYIELEPGDSKKKGYKFTGLEEPPVTSSNVPGLRLILNAEKTGSLSIGAPIYHRGFPVGRVERCKLDAEKNKITFHIFIQEQYAQLVYENTHFWNASGIHVDAGADGFKIQSPSLRALVAGGVSFGVLKGEKHGALAKNMDDFVLFEDQNTAAEATFVPDYKILLFFDQSVRGLKRGAPVEFRGIPFGRVSDISYNYGSHGDPRVPVLIEVDSIAMRDKFLSKKLNDDLMQELIERGVHAKLSTASLLTGALFVEFAFDDELRSHKHKLQYVDNLPVIPTEISGLNQLENKIDDFLDKLNAMPLDTTLASFSKAADEAALTLEQSRKTLDEFDKTLADAHKLLGSKETQALDSELTKTLVELRKTIESVGPNGTVQGDLRRTLDELRAAIRSFDSLSRTIDDKPNSIIFGKDSSGNAIPRARK